MTYTLEKSGKTSFEQLIKRFVNYAQANSDIRAAIILGSRARLNNPADEWSDLDIMVITTEPEKYLSTTDWLEGIGKVWLTFVEKTGTGGQKERRVLFEGGLDVDFAIIPEKLALHFRKEELLPQVVEIFRRGIRVLLDKDGLFENFSSAPVDNSESNPPTQLEFLEVINDFLYHAVWTAKKLQRGELWTAKACSDSYMKWLLLRMIEWHAKATHDWKYDTWHDGRFLEQWADPDVIRELQDAFARYEKDDTKRTLLKTMELFRRLGVEIASKLGYNYPDETDERVTKLIKTYLSNKA